MARLLRRPRSRGLGKRAWGVMWSIRLVLWTLGSTRIIKAKIVNADVVPSKGAVILAANHTSMIDVFFILAALRREAIAMAMAELWKSPFTRWLVEVLGQIPVVRATRSPGSTGDGTRITGIGGRGVGRHLSRAEVREAGRGGPYRPGVAVLSSGRVCRSSRSSL